MGDVQVNLAQKSVTVVRGSELINSGRGLKVYGPLTGNILTQKNTVIVSQPCFLGHLTDSILSIWLDFTKLQWLKLEDPTIADDLFLGRGELFPAQNALRITDRRPVSEPQCMLSLYTVTICSVSLVMLGIYFCEIQECAKKKNAKITCFIAILHGA